MTARTVKTLAWGSLGFVIACSIVSIAYAVLARDSPLPPSAFGPKGFAAGLGLVLGITGSIVATRQPANPIGWIFCGAAMLAAIQAVGSSYALWALVEEEGRPPGGTWGAWLDEWTWIPIVGALGVVAAIFPSGRFLTPAWRRVVTVGIVGSALASVFAAFVPELTIYTGHHNPAGLEVDALGELAGVSILFLMFLMLTGTASAFTRFRRSSADEREQLKWLALSIAFVVAMLTVYAVIAIPGAWEANPQGADWVENLMILAILSVPVAIGIGVLKYRLYDIDIVINKAVVYGTLAVFITLVYIAIVAVVGAALGSRDNTILSALAAAIVALAFQPARRRAQHLANRLVYGKRATPYEVLSELSSRFAGTFSLDDALPRLARVTTEAVGAERSRIWLRSDEEFHQVAAWPEGVAAASTRLSDTEFPDFWGEKGFAVRHQGELLGAITVSMTPSEALGPAQEKLLGDVASQAGLVLRNVALLEDLRASRKRIVTAQDARAKQLERNIHDGAQQQLVALTVKLRLAQGLVAKDPEKAGAMLEELQAETQAAVEDLRDLARGIYPPLLADKGLRDAIEAQGRKASIPLRVQSDGIGRYPQDVESAVYFCTLEALQNVAKYARASSVSVLLAQRNGRLEFEISDDGTGFDPAAVPRGAGLQNMTDRIEALGGSLEIASAPGNGTTVSGHVPILREAVR